MCIDENFKKFHQDNPRIFELFHLYATQTKEAGHKRYSAKTIIERIRWHVNVETRTDDEFKINNNYTSRYSRLLEQTYPEFQGFLYKRKLRS